MRHVVALSSVFAMILSMTAFGADGTPAPSIKVPGTPPPLPPNTSADREKAPCCDHAHEGNADHGHLHEPAVGRPPGMIGPEGEAPIKAINRMNSAIDLAYDKTTDSIIVYLPDGSTVRRSISELPLVRPQLPFRDMERSEAGIDDRFTCDGANCRLADTPAERRPIDGSHFRPWQCPPPEYGCQGRGCCYGNSSHGLAPYSYGRPPYGGFYRP
jgi:hypothetical protein